jgi:N-acetylmuramoyl-L-alanine amidase CwlA
MMPIRQAFVPMDEHTRSGIKLPIVQGVVIHYTGQPGQSLNSLTEYLEKLSNMDQSRYASWHYGVGIEGEIDQVIPEDECAWHAGPSNLTRPEILERFGGKPNWRTIGIEMCHPSNDGAITRATWRATVSLVAEIFHRHNITNINRCVRHYDCTRKICPKWFVDHPADWAEFQHDIRSRL